MSQVHSFVLFLRCIAIYAYDHFQEVETDQYHSFFRPELQRQGYDGIFSAKSRAKTMGEHDRRFVDGCAIFYDKRRLVNDWQFVEEVLTEPL